LIRWEYYWLVGRLNEDKPAGVQFRKDLEALGQQGWEAVSSHGDVLQAAVLLKRPLSDD
jgi:hypothetical protein